MSVNGKQSCSSLASWEASLGPSSSIDVVGTRRVALPLGAKVQISCVAVSAPRVCSSATMSSALPGARGRTPRPQVLKLIGKNVLNQSEKHRFLYLRCNWCLLLLSHCHLNRNSNDSVQRFEVHPVGVCISTAFARNGLSITSPFPCRSAQTQL